MVKIVRKLETREKNSNCGNRSGGTGVVPLIDKLQESPFIVTKSWLIYIFLFYFLLFKPALEQLFTFVKYSDELIALLAIPIWGMQRKKEGTLFQIKNDIESGWLMLFVAVGLVGNLKHQYQPLLSAVLPDVLLNIKFWLALYVGEHIYCKLNIQRYARRMFKNIKFVTWLFLILIVIDNIFFVFPENIRYGLRSTQLFYGHPTSFAANAVWIITILMTIKENCKESVMGYIIVWLVMLCTTMRSKALGEAMAIVLIYYFVYIRKKKVKIKTLLLFVPAVLLVGWNQVEFYFLSGERNGIARFQLLNKAFEIAKDNFPFGTGFGTYASYYSGVIYSPVYGIYGLSNIWGLVENASSFISDSFWPMILGQTGYAGMGIFVIVLWKLYKKIQSVKKYSVGQYVSALVVFVYALIASTSESAFVNPMMIPMALWLGYLLRDRKITEKVENNI